MQNVIILSSAGGGKTTQLISRYKALEQLDNKEKILTISFTNASCDDINERYNIGAQTLHSFLYQFVDKEIDSLANLECFLEDFPNLKAMPLRVVKNLVENYFIFDEFPKNIDFLEEEKDINNEFKDLISIIKDEKNNHEMCFFSDIINICLENIFHILPIISEKYNHILIDECQDFSLKQLELLLQIIRDAFCEEEKSFFIVGDIKQSIYWFQGSSPTYYTWFINTLEEICSKESIPLKVINQSRSYRFGGDIINKVNSIYSGHQSEVKEGKVTELSLNKKDAIEFIKLKVNNNSMILYERITSFISLLQEELGVGHCKVYTKESTIVEALWHIVYWQQTKSLYHLGRILQGPFFYMNEPDFYNIAIEKAFPLLKFPIAPYELLCELKKNIFCSKLDYLILNEIFKKSYYYSTLWEMMSNLEDYIEIKSNGPRFITIHSAKGLESDTVFYIKQPLYKEKIFVNLKPFFFSKKKMDSSYIRENVEYVALTRAKENLYILNVLQ